VGVWALEKEAQFGVGGEVLQLLILGAGQGGEAENFRGVI